MSYTMIIRNTPDALRKALKVEAAKRGMTLRDLVILVLAKEVKK